MSGTSGTGIVTLDRYWLPVGRTYQLTHDGWLAEPTIGPFYSTNGDALTTSELLSHRCLVLLGEPGMGKTSAIKSHAPLHPASSEISTLHFSLGSFTSEDRLARKVFENDTVETWKAGVGDLCLTLDGFDEAHNRIEGLHQLVLEYLRDWPCERLFFRLACRTADWPRSLEFGLTDLFGDANVHELLPLHRADASTLLRSAGVEPEVILKAVEAARLVPLASRPLTLGLLQRAIGSGGTLPETASELYARGLRALADEQNRERRGRALTTGNPDERLSVAARMAAISIFSGRAAIWIGPVADADTSDLTFDDCIESRSDATSTRMSSDTVDSVLRTGLFTGHGNDRLGWAHATFADHLAARFIIEKQLGDEQVESLLLSEDRRIHSRGRQIAAWLVAIEPSRFRWLIRCDSEAFLHNVDMPDERLRGEVVDALFEDVRAGDLYDDYSMDFTGLKHAALADQLRPALADPNIEVARVAVRIARVCQAEDLVPDLTAVALDSRFNPGLRVAAAMAVNDLSAAAPSHGLVPLLRRRRNQSSDSDDVSDELEGAALMASWPHAVSTAEVFAMIDPRHRPNYYGVYSIFITDFAEKLRPEDLDAACDWLEDNLERVDDSRLSTLTESILRLCASNLDNPKARSALQQVALRRAGAYAPLFTRSDSGPSRGECRSIALMLLQDAREDQIYSIIEMMPGHGLGLLDRDDFGWLLDEFVAADDPKLRGNLETALTRMYWPEHIPHSDIVLGLPDDHPAAPLFAYWRSTMIIDSPEAVSARNVWLEYAGRRKERSREQDLDSWVNPQITEFIEAARTGDVAKYCRAARLVTVRPKTNQYWDEFQPDLTSHPRWETLPEETRRGFVQAAPYYLSTAKCEPEQWLGRGLNHLPSQAAYRAFILLLRLNPKQLSDLPPEVWREWAPILVDWSVTVNGASGDDKDALFAYALPHARSELTSSARVLLEKELAEGQHIFHRHELQLLMTDALADWLVEMLRVPMAGAVRDGILDILDVSHIDKTLPVLSEWLAPDARANEPARAKDALLRLLRSSAVEQAWPQIRHLMDVDPDFVQSALLAGGSYHDRTVPHLPAMDLADLYSWLCEHIPAEEDPQFDDAHFVGPRESVGQWRDALLDSLKRAGTAEAVAAVTAICQRFPEKSWLNRVLVDARRAMREQSWLPISPLELDQLASSRTARLIRNDADLVSASLAAFEDLQGRLQGDTPSAMLLWDTHSGRPKVEDEVSDFLAIEVGRRLAERGVIVNREVQVRRIQPTGLPERTDLRIEALVPSESGAAAGAIKIPCEVKGAWNAGAITSVESQLVQRYMADFQTDHGIYVALWFDQDSWTDTDDRRKTQAARFASAEDLRASLLAEADKQASEGRTIAVVVLDASLRRPAAVRGASE